MSTPFDASIGMVIVTATIHGPTGVAYARLAVDTGATLTVIRSTLLTAVGYDPAASTDRLQMTTGSQVEDVAALEVDLLDALDCRQTNLRVVAHTLPPTIAVDGLLGLNFLRGRDLLISFRTGQVTLT